MSEIRKEDLRIDTFRGSRGPVAVRVTHVPTGLSGEAVNTFTKYAEHEAIGYVRALLDTQGADTTP